MTGPRVELAHPSPIGCSQLWRTRLPTKHRQLISSYDDLELVERLRATTQLEFLTDFFRGNVAYQEERMRRLEEIKAQDAADAASRLASDESEGETTTHTDADTWSSWSRAQRDARGPRLAW